ncbi:MAG: hypothetical protein ABT24_14600 [Thiomonas sp. SCN 64-16]|uniref:hypothetical protein n=1 Tax=Thiomonas sp. SCN 64-16 TaxID=1660151 RepID=UPI00086E18BF|nr:hypothetical protein [Thiomonas sp. SCN 64-16]ODU91516.1 MAG: hypothetical protein ABT24_14600 [Thiomonas sp. SCN 64-16]
MGDAAMADAGQLPGSGAARRGQQDSQTYDTLCGTGGMDDDGSLDDCGGTGIQGGRSQGNMGAGCIAHPAPMRSHCARHSAMPIPAHSTAPSTGLSRRMARANMVWAGAVAGRMR